MFNLYNILNTLVTYICLYTYLYNPQEYLYICVDSKDMRQVYVRRVWWYQRSNYSLEIERQTKKWEDEKKTKTKTKTKNKRANNYTEH